MANTDPNKEKECFIFWQQNKKEKKRNFFCRKSLQMIKSVTKLCFCCVCDKGLPECGLSSQHNRDMTEHDLHQTGSLKATAWLKEPTDRPVIFTNRSKNRWY